MGLNDFVTLDLVDLEDLIEFADLELEDLVNSELFRILGPFVQFGIRISSGWGVSRGVSVFVWGNWFFLAFLLIMQGFRERNFDSLP